MASGGTEMRRGSRALRLFVPALVMTTGLSARHRIS
jgi:hypothetical protein